MTSAPVSSIKVGMIGALRRGAASFGFIDDGADYGDGMTELSPLYVLLTVMRQRWEAKDLDGAVALAKVAAPYLHGRAAVSRPAGDLAGVTDDELEHWGGGEGAAAAPAGSEEPG